MECAGVRGRDSSWYPHKSDSVEDASKNALDALQSMIMSKIYNFPIQMHFSILAGGLSIHINHLPIFMLQNFGQFGNNVSQFCLACDHDLLGRQ